MLLRISLPLCLAAWPLASTAGPDPAQRAEPAVLSAEILGPAPGAKLVGAEWVEVRGRAVHRAAGPRDVVIAVDLSQSALLPSGGDIDGDGVTGALRARGMRRASGAYRPIHTWTTDPDDVVARAALLGAQRLLRRLSADPDGVRVALWTFAGKVRKRVALGPPSEALAGLDRIRLARDDSGTDLARVIRHATRALAPSRAAGREALLVLLSDGIPTVPQPERIAARAALREASRAGAAGVRIFAAALGPDAAEVGALLEQVAARSGGRWLAADDPDQVLRWLPRLDAAALERAEIHNATTGQPARALRWFEDGSFEGWLPLRPGANEVRVLLTTRDGRSVQATRRVFQRPGTAAQRAAAERALLERLREQSLATSFLERARRGRTRSLEVRTEPD